MTIEREMTREFVNNAFAGESQAHMRYLLFARRAEEEEMPNIARLFRAIAYAEMVHAGNHYRALGGIGETADNIRVAIEGETHEVDEMYPVYKQAAHFQGEKEAETYAHYALEAEKIHAELYSRARTQAEKGRDMDLGTVYVCPVCGYTVEDEAPDCCPVCGAPGKRFRSFPA